MKYRIGQRFIYEGKLVQLVDIKFRTKTLEVFGITRTTHKTTPDIYVRRDELDSDISKYKI